MDCIGIDLHKKESQICVMDASGKVLEEVRIKTSRQKFGELFSGRPHGLVLLEASTESEWVARILEEHGHEVVVADPNFAPMYSTRSKKIKTDRRDAHALANAARLGAYKKAHRPSDGQRILRTRLAVREQLVRTRAGIITLIRSSLRQEGVGVAKGSTEKFTQRLKQVELSEMTRSVILPLVESCEALNKQIAACDEILGKNAEEDPRIARLTTAPGVGPVVASAFVAAIDDVGRFKKAHQVESYLGLVPREYSSGEKQQRGSIHKGGDGRARWLLVQSAWCIMRSRQNTALKQWATQLAQRRGKWVAIIGLARKLAGTLFAMWRDETEFKAKPAKDKWAELMAA